MFNRDATTLNALSELKRHASRGRLLSMDFAKEQWWMGFWADTLRRANKKMTWDEMSDEAGVSKNTLQRCRLVAVKYDSEQKYDAYIASHPEFESWKDVLRDLNIRTDERVVCEKIEPSETENTPRVCKDRGEAATEIKASVPHKIQCKYEFDPRYGRDALRRAAMKILDNASEWQWEAAMKENGMS